MKTIKLLAALAVPAMFAACTNEDILSENPQKMQQEIVGAELVGTGISLNVTDGSAQSRIANQNGKMVWTSDDRLGLGWLLDGDNDATKVQSESKHPKFSKVWANNLFQQEGEEQGIFTTKGNIYAGWQFAYFPFEYQDAPGSYKFVKVNPAQKTMNLEKRYSQNFHISARQFIEKGDLDDNFQLTTPFTLNNVMNTLYMTTKAVEGSAFETGKNLAGLKITSVTINAGAAVFTDSLLLKAVDLPVEGDTILRDVMPKLFKCYKADKSEGRDSILTTKIDTTYLVSSGKGENRIMPIALPSYDNLNVDTAKVAIEIEAGAGKFTVKYVTNAKENTPAALNNAVIEKLIAAYTEKDGAMTQWTGFVQLGEIQLYDAIYKADYTDIENIEEWNEAVFTANALKENNPVFTLAEKADVIFTDSINVPDNGVKVQGSNKFTEKMTVTGEIGWPSNIVGMDAGVNLIVNDGAVLDVEGSLWASRIVNKGTIKASATSQIGEEERFDNSDGRVIVEYGAYVYPATGKEGTIAYVATKKDETNPKRIAELVETSSGSQKGYAHVNTIIINDTISIDFTKPISGTDETKEEGRYTDTTTPGIEADQYDYGNLQEVTLEINGGEVSSTTEEITVKAIEMKGGSVTDVDVSGKLTLVEGTNSVRNSSIGEVVVAAGTNNIETETIGSVVIKGGNNTLNVTTISGSMTAKGENYLNVETIGGGVDFENTSSTAAATIAGAAITGNVTLKGDILLDNVTIGGDLTVTSGTVKTINLAVGGKLTNDGSIVLVSESTMNIGTLVNNATLTSNNDINVTNVTLNVGSVTTLDSNSEEVGYDKTIWYTGDRVQDRCTVNGTITQYSGAVLAAAVAAAKDGDVVTLNGDAVLSEPIKINKKLTINLNGKKVSLEGSTVTSAVFEADGANAVLTIEGEGTVHADGAMVGADGKSGVQAVCGTNGATIIINGGTFTTDDDVNGERNDCIYVKTDSQIIINDGKFEYIGSNADGHKFLLNCKDGSSLITVNGGKFKNHAPSYESTGTGEVRLGTGKQVYNGETVVTGAHTGVEDVWYTVK